MYPVQRNSIAAPKPTGFTERYFSVVHFASEWLRRSRLMRMKRSGDRRRRSAVGTQVAHAGSRLGDAGFSLLCPPSGLQPLRILRGRGADSGHGRCPASVAPAGAVCSRRADAGVWPQPRDGAQERRSGLGLLQP